MKHTHRSFLMLALGIASVGLFMANEDASAVPIYGYTYGGTHYNTLEEVEYAMRQDPNGVGGYPLMELAFPIPNNFYQSPGSPSSLDYRPLGALSSASQILTLGASTVSTSYQPYVIGWPPATLPSACQTSACPAGACNSFPAQVALVQCTFDTTWHTRGNFSWNRQGTAQGTNQITGSPQVIGAGQTSGVLKFVPPSSSSSGWGSTISITASPAAGTSLASSEEELDTGGDSPTVNSQFNWNIQRQDAITCPSGAKVSGSATSAADACQSPLQKELVTGFPVTQSPGQCGVGDPCYPSNGNNRASENVFQYGALNFRIHYNSLRQNRPYSYIDRNWSHSYAKRILTEWSSSGHLTGAESQGISVAQAFVQDERSDLEVFVPAGPLGTFRSTSSLGKALVYMPRAGTAAPFWQLDQGNGVIEIYDRAGRYIQRIDADDPSRNLMISYFGGQIDIDASYSANGPHQQEDFWRINRVTDGNGRYASFQYSNDNYLWLTRIVADDGLTVLAEFHYDSDHRMERLTYADLSERTYLYNEPSNIFVGGAIPTGLRGYWLTGILDEDNRRFGTFRYDDWGRVVDNWHGTDSEKVHIDYLSDSASKVTFPSGVETTFNYAANEPYRHPGASSNTAGTRQYEYYPSNHRLKKVTDANNNVSEQEYDLLGIHLTAKVEAKNTPEQRRTEFDWDAPTNRIYEKRIYKQPNNGTSVLTHRVVYGYNTGGALLSSTETDVLSGATRTNTFDYCPNTSSLSGCVLGRLRSIDGPRTDVADVTTLRYYTTADLSGCATVNGGECHQLGDLKSITNAVGQVVTYAKYDRAGRVIRVRDANNVLTDFSYSVRGWLTDRISRANANGSSSPQDAKTHFTYDGSGNVKRVTFPDLAFPAYSLEYSYDSAHRLTGVIDSHGNSASYTLDPSGNRTGESYLNDQGVLKRSLGRIYDELGRLERVLNSQGIPVLTSALPPDSPPAGITYTGGYDGNGNSVYSYDGLGRDTFRQYDALNRLTTIMQDHSGQSSATQDATTEMQYDERDNLVSVTDPDDLTTGYVHDGLNNLRSITSPDTGTTFYTPDNAGNRTAQTDARGVTGTYAFDALNRLTSITFASSPSENVSYAYDLADRTTGCSGAASNGHLSRMMDESGMTTYCYDRRGNVVRKAQDGVIQRVVEYSYDRADRLLSMTYPSGAVVTYVRDAIGRIIAVTRKADAAAPAVSIISSATYLPFGPLNQLTYGNGRTLTKSYDGDYAIDSVVSSDPNGLLIDFTTNVMGNIIDASDSLGANPKTRTYQYDPLYRLTDVLDGTSASVEHYTYSATGDRTSRQLGNQAPQVHAYAAGSHRIESIDGVYRGYDANGNTEIRGSGPQFSYGERNRLSTVTLPSGQSLFGRGGGANQIFYRYNGRGERVVQRQSLMLQETNYLYDEAGHQVGKYVGMDAMSLGEEIIYLDDLPVAITFNGVLSYLETDHLGTPRVAANPSTNAQQWKWDFFGDAFGDNAATIAPSGGVDVRLRYPGQYFDAESGLHYNYFRDYEPGTGRYVESDPIGLGGGNSTYAYTRSAPLGRTDHLGLWGSQKTRYIHQWSWQRVAPQGMTTADQWAVEYALGYADREEYQDAAHAYMHAMNGDKAMSTDKACAKSNDFIKSQYEEAWELDSQGKHREALFQFGIALHTIQDSMSPAHSGFQLWTGEETKREIFDHLTRELSDPGSGSELDTATRNAWEWYSSRQFPTNGAVKCDCP